MICTCDNSPLFPRCIKELSDCNRSKKIPGYMQTPPDWCDDCNTHPGEKCPDCGCTHNC